MDINRKVAFDILLDISKEGAFSNLAVKNHLEKSENLNTAFIREMVYGVLENQIYFDHIIDRLAQKGIKGIKPKELTLLRMGLYQIIEMDSVPDYAAINETVSLSKKVSYGKDRFINGMLRSFLRRKDEDFTASIESDDERMRIRYSFTLWIVDLWKEQFPQTELWKLLKASNMKPYLVIRGNLSKISIDELASRLSKFNPRNSTFTPRGLIVDGKNLLDVEEYKEGLFSIQDETSIVAADMIQPQKGDRILDMCAAPGGKTMAMAEMLEQGEIIAMDIYEHKLFLIEEQAKRLGLKSVKTRCQDASKLLEEFEGAFDKVLCDVPCSGLGVIRHKPEIKLKEEGNLDDLYITQGQILENAAKYVKKGGSLVYSTCTINKRENQDQIKKILERNGDFEMVFERQYLPHVDGTDGFYIAKLNRK